MPDTDRLYAMSSTPTSPYWIEEAGPGLLIHDPALAMRWYFTHEREAHLAVTAHASDDGGATWHPLPVSELHSEAQHRLLQDDTDTAAKRNAMAQDAAAWLDARIRYVHLDDPGPRTPALTAWNRGGHLWALALGTLPGNEVLDHLTALYPTPQPDGPERLRAGAHDTLTALALAQSPSQTATETLLQAVAHLDRLTLGPEVGQLRTLAQDAQNQLADHLATRLEPNTPTHPPHHPTQQAARAYIRSLARLGPLPDQELRVHLRLAFYDTLSDAEHTPSPPPKRNESTALTGYPQRPPSDQQAAARWRLLSPAARRDAEQAMSQLARAAHAETTPTPGSPQAHQRHTSDHARAARQLDDLTSQHALLMHATILADAEDAAPEARKAASDTPGPPHALADIARALDEQRQITRDALQRLDPLYPRVGNNTSTHLLRTRLIGGAGLGLDAYLRAGRAVMQDPGNGRNRSRHLEAATQTPLTTLQRSRAITLRALKALEGIAHLAPSYEPAAIRTAWSVRQDPVVHDSPQDQEGPADPRRITRTQAPCHQAQHAGTTRPLQGQPPQ